MPVYFLFLYILFFYSWLLLSHKKKSNKPGSGSGRLERLQKLGEVAKAKNTEHLLDMENNRPLPPHPFF